MKGPTPEGDLFQSSQNSPSQERPDMGGEKENASRSDRLSRHSPTSSRKRLNMRI